MQSERRDRVPGTLRLFCRAPLFPLVATMAGMAVAGLLMAAVMHSLSRWFEEEGVTVVGEVTRVHRYDADDFGIFVDYTEPDGTQASHVFRVDAGYPLPDVGAAQPVRIIPGRAVLDLDSDRGGGLPVFPLVFGAGFGIGTLLVGRSLWRQVRRHRRLLTRGVPAEAEIVAVHGDEDDVRFSYVYYPITGPALRGETRRHPAADVGHLRRGDVLDILVDPDDPRQSLWPPDALSGTEARTSASVGLSD